MLDQGTIDASDTLKMHYPCVRASQKLRLTGTFLKLTKAQLKPRRGRLSKPSTDGLSRSTYHIDRDYKLRSGYVALLAIRDSFHDATTDGVVKLMETSKAKRACKKAKKGSKKRKHHKKNRKAGAL